MSSWLEGHEDQVQAILAAGNGVTEEADGLVALLFVLLLDVAFESIPYHLLLRQPVQSAGSAEQAEEGPIKAPHRCCMG